VYDLLVNSKLNAIIKDWSEQLELSKTAFVLSTIVRNYIDRLTGVLEY